MKIKMVRGVALGGGIDGEPGKVYEVGDAFGRSLIARGKAVVYAEKEKQAKPLEEMKAGELIAYAEEHDLDIGGLQAQAGQPKVLAAVKAAIEKKQGGQE